MKSKIIWTEQKSFYPRLMISNDETNVVLFFEECVGTVVWAVNHEECFGKHYTDLDMAKYRAFKNTIELSN